MKTSQSRLVPFIETLLIALLGVLIFHLLSLPLPWMLGPLSFMMLAKKYIRRPLYWPNPLFNVGIVIIGFYIGSSFQKETFRELADHLPAMLVMTIILILFSLLLAYLLAKMTKSHFDSVLIGSMPGGLTQMVLLGQELKHIDVNIVAVSQMIRITMIVFFIPLLTIKFVYTGDLSAIQASGDGQEVLTALSEEPVRNQAWTSYLWYALAILAGIWIAVKIRLTTPFLLGPFLATILLILIEVPLPELPSSTFILTQIIIGTRIGCMLNPDKFGSIKKLGLYTFFSNILLIIFAFLMALLLMAWFPVSLVTAFLSTSPGGMAEMGITAKVVGADLAILSGYQLFRIFFILLVMLPLLKWWLTRKQQGSNKQEVVIQQGQNAKEG